MLPTGGFSSDKSNNYQTETRQLLNSLNNPINHNCPDNPQTFQFTMYKHSKVVKPLTPVLINSRVEQSFQGYYDVINTHTLCKCNQKPTHVQLRIYNPEIKGHCGILSASLIVDKDVMYKDEFICFSEGITKLICVFILRKTLLTTVCM